ncbi:MAG: (2Fe-2S)-binding protein [Synechococcaceae bacterium WB8_1B_136]|nr:(2Fe-2S)-binding protein [Synechococcaceae bacterium WB8_1B_136]
MKQVQIRWPNGKTTRIACGSDWLDAARAAGFAIPTGCMGGSCGACEIDVNGQTVRACITTVPTSRSGELSVELSSDPYW